MPKRMMTEDEYAAWQQNAKAGFKPPKQGVMNTATENYFASLKTLESDKPTKRTKGKRFGR